MKRWLLLWLAHMQNSRVRSAFAWQLGYGAFSVSKSNVPEVLIYIGNQQAHHKRLSFKEEFLDFLTRHAIEYDERYIWN